MPPWLWGRPLTRANPAPLEVPEQAGPSAQSDLREQLDILAEVTKQQCALLQKMCDTFIQWPIIAPRLSEPQEPPQTTSVGTPAAIAPPLAPAPAPAAPTRETSHADRQMTGRAGADYKEVDSLFQIQSSPLR